MKKMCFAMVVLILTVAQSCFVWAADDDFNYRHTDKPRHLHFSDEQLLEKHRKYLFSDLTASQEIALQGSYGTRALDFGGRRDEVVTKADMTLFYTYSPALIPGLSHVKMYLNGELIGLLPVDKKNASRQVSTTVKINPHLFANFNSLSFELIGHYAEQCEDPQHSSIWFNISKNSFLEITTLPLTLKNELVFFPQPFFDTQDFTRQPLPFIFPAKRDQKMLRAAGVAASWFGVQAAWRGVEFPVLYDRLPSRHAVVFATNKDRPYFLKNYPQIKLPTIEVVSHPDFDHIKLLLVLGRNNDDLITAAEGIALGTSGFSGNATYIKKIEHIIPREPYDAPNWVRTDRPMKLIELVQSPNELQVSGYLPPSISISMNVPADLFTWRSIGIPIDLKYRYTRPVKLDESRLNISINNQFIQSFNLQGTGQGGRKERVRVPLLGGLFGAANQMFIPAFKVGSTNQLNFSFSFASYSETGCGGGRVFNVKAAMDSDTEIDFTGFPHYAEMPNLTFFANSGFPFTKYADLSNTTVVINRQTQANELEVMLTLLGTMGASTGYAALKHTLAYPDQLGKLQDKDILVVNALTGDLLEAAKENGLPALLSANNRQFAQPVLSSKENDDKSDYKSTQDSRTSTLMDIAGTGGLAALVGFESPYSSERSVVSLMATSALQLDKAIEALTNPGKISQMYGNVTLFRGNQVNSNLVGDTYFVGSLPAWTLIWFHLSERPFLLIFCTLIAITIIAFTLWRILLAASIKRLRDSGHEI